MQLTWLRNEPHQQCFNQCPQKQVYIDMGAFLSQKPRRYRGVEKVDQDGWAARYELDDEAHSKQGAQASEPSAILR